MTEGWLNNEYIILFSEAESSALSSRYHLPRHLPNCVLIGLCSWDDFILGTPSGTMCTVPTVPIDHTMVKPFSLPETITLQPDDRLTGKIRWYLKPLIFGGNPKDESNLTWVTLEQHAELVAWWNDQYAELKAQSRLA